MALLVGGIVGAEFSSREALATLPLTMMVIGLAIGALPAAKLLNTCGYKILYLAGCLLSFIAIAVGITALYQKSFALWLLAMAFTGLSSACAQQMRFVASSFVKPSDFSVALSVFMLAGALAAVLGPEIATQVDLFDWPRFVGGYAALCILQLAGLIAVLLWRTPPCVRHDTNQTIDHTRSKGILAIVASVTAYGIMSFVMTATPLSMHGHHGHSLVDTKTVIQWHILAMFLPSLVSGKFIQYCGISRSLGVGLLTYAAASTITLSGIAFLHYSTGLILLGVGWNILFTAGSTLAARHPNPNFKGQHDTLVFGAQALASLSAGIALVALGWQGLQWLALGGLLPLALLLTYPVTAKTQGLDNHSEKES